MSKKPRHKVTLSEAIQNIPHDGAYCNDSGQCPYWRLRHCHSKGQMIRKAKKAHIIGIPCWNTRNHTLEYCMFLREYLSIQDGCKDCGINEEIWDYDSEEIVGWTVGCKRLSNREYADMYKEIFPEEVDLIDKIVEEDKLEYWCKKEEDE